MSTTVHNPDQYMASLRHIVAQGRKRVGILIGAGAPLALPHPSGNGPIIPAIDGLTKLVVEELEREFGAPIDGIRGQLRTAGETDHVEAILSRVRGLSAVIGATEVHGLDAAGHKRLADAICHKIGEIVDQVLPQRVTPYHELVSWLAGTDRAHPVEIFTTNYDLLLEEALQQAHAPYFDGFAGGPDPFFDPSSIGNNDLPKRWPRLWKLHGSLGWALKHGGVVRLGDRKAAELVYPENRKYEQTQKAPYAALLDRLTAFLQTPDTLLLTTGFSHSDSHITSRIEEALAGNPSAAVIAFQFRAMSEEHAACSIAERRGNFSVYCPDQAMISSIRARWQPGDLPTRDWEPIRATYWGGADAESPQFLLGSFALFARFLAMSRAGHAAEVAMPSGMSAPQSGAQ